jgi:hypothetical protein
MRDTRLPKGGAREKSYSTEQALEERLMTRREVARYLRVSLDGIRTLQRREVDPLPVLMAGRRFLYERREVLKWARREANRARNMKG